MARRPQLPRRQRGEERRLHVQQQGGEQRPAHVQLRQHDEVVERRAFAFADRAPQHLRIEVHVGIGEQQVLAARDLRAGVQRVRLAQPARRQLRDVQRTQAGFVERQPVQDGACGIGGAVVDGHHFQARVVEREQRPQGRLDGGGFVQCADHDRHRRQRVARCRRQGRQLRQARQATHQRDQLPGNGGEDQQREPEARHDGCARLAVTWPLRRANAGARPACRAARPAGGGSRS
jgi:hypothetical protein